VVHLAGKKGVNLGLQITGLDKAQRQMGRAKQEARNMRPLFEKAIIILEQSHMQTFRQGGRPKWTPSKRAQAQGGQTLQDTGRLRQTVTGRAPAAIRQYNNEELRFGTKLIYAPSHQYGFPPRNIPQRPFLGVYSEDMKKMEKVFEDDLSNRLRVVTSG